MITEKPLYFDNGRIPPEMQKLFENGEITLIKVVPLNSFKEIKMTIKCPTEHYYQDK